MIAFEISELDVQRAVKNQMNIELSEKDAMRIFNKLDLERVSDRAAFESDGDGGTDEDDAAMDEAIERAHDEIIRQIKTRELIA